MTISLISELKQQSASGADDAISLLKELVQIPSITGDELAVQQKLSTLLSNLKLEVDQWCPTYAELASHPAFSDDGLPIGSRPVLVAKWKGRGKGRSLILNGHVDVVPPGDPTAWNHSPWSGYVNDGNLYGRGSCDMKGGLLSGILAIKMLQQMNFQPRGDVLVQCVIGEETGGIGTLATIVRGYRADAAIVLEPTRLALCPVGAGAASFRLHVPGLAAHGAMRFEGVNAIEKFFLIYRALMELEHERNFAFSNPLFQSGMAAPICVGKISAGDWPSTVPEILTAEGRFGVLPGENIAAAREIFERKISIAAGEDPWLQDHAPRIEWFEGQFESAETPLDAEFLQVLGDSHQEVIGTLPNLHGVSYGSDLRFFTNYARIPAVLYGPGDVAHAHTVNEFISLQEVFTAAQVVAFLITRWCG
jgi:acetylornithine deacetylase